MWLLDKLIRPQFLYDGDPASGGGSATMTEDEKAAAQKVADDKAASDQAAVDKKAAEDAAAATAALPDNVKALNEQVAKQTELLNKLIEKSSNGVAQDEWTIEKLEDAELKCHNGVYDMKYLPKITTLKSLLTARQVAGEEREKYSKESTWADVQAKWVKGQSDAVAVFGDDANDTQSKLFKTAQAILMQDPGYARYQELKSKGVAISSIDPSLIDPNLQFKCFEIAAGRLGVARKDSPPDTTPRGGSRTALGGRTLPTNEGGQSLLDKLESKAVASGDQRDWIALDKERLKQQREREGR